MSSTDESGMNLTTSTLISEHTNVPVWVFGLAPAIYTMGIFLHYLSDAQKFFILRIQKGLIEDKLFAGTRIQTM